MFGEKCSRFPSLWWLQNNCSGLKYTGLVPHSSSLDLTLCLKKRKGYSENTWFMISRDRRSQRNVKCKAKTNSRFSELTGMLPWEKYFSLVIRERSHSELGGRRHSRFIFVQQVSFVVVETSFLAWSTQHWWKEFDGYFSYQNKLVSLLF